MTREQLETRFEHITEDEFAELRRQMEKEDEK